MSRAFVKENDRGDEDALPERVVSPHANFVTARGLRLLEARIRELEAERVEARAADDAARVAVVARDLRYFTARRDSARLVAPPEHPDVVRFGVRVTLELADGTRREFRLVGEDEAAPGEGLLSYVSPLASELLGRRAGDEVDFAGGIASLVRIDG
jgi:transcription elongation GreA/GreB family factor